MGARHLVSPSARPSVDDSQSSARATCTRPRAGSDRSDCGNCTAAAPSHAHERVSLATAHFRRGPRPLRMRSCPGAAGALGEGTSGSPARRGAQWPPPGPAGVHRCLSESRAVPTTQGVLAGGLWHQDLASVLRTVTYLRKWSLRYSTKTSREVIVYSWCRKSGLNSIGQNKERAAWR